VTAQDNAGGSGVASIEYSVDEGAFQPYTGPFSIARQGTTIVRARATDREGNIEDPASSRAIMIDGSSPAVSINSPASRDYLHSDRLQISFGATDSVAGLAAGTLATLDHMAVANGQTIQPFMPSGYTRCRSQRRIVPAIPSRRLSSFE